MTLPPVFRQLTFEEASAEASAGLLVRSILATGRSSEAAAVEARAKELDPSAEMASELAKR